MSVVEKGLQVAVAHPAQHA